jgi:hypothetical protein
MPDMVRVHFSSIAPAPFALPPALSNRQSIDSQFCSSKLIRSQGHDNWSLSVFWNGDIGNAEQSCLVLDSAESESLPLASEERCAPTRIRASPQASTPFSSLFGSLDIVFQQADFYACTVRALGQISVAHPNQIDAIHRDLVVQHQVSCY